MTENKRFTILTDNAGYNYTVQDKGIDLNDIDLVFLLNDLHEENQALKQSDNITDLETEIMKLREENQHIKNTIQDMIQTERTEIGKSVLNQLWSRIQ